eukprot:3112597-Amphidinium_carterae.1
MSIASSRAMGAKTVTDTQRCLEEALHANPTSVPISCVIQFLPTLEVQLKVAPARVELEAA